MKITPAQYQMSAALRNFWPEVYPEINQISYGPLMISKINEHLAPWKCKFVYTETYEDGDFVFDSDEDRVLFLLKWGGAQ